VQTIAVVRDKALFRLIKEYCAHFMIKWYRTFRVIKKEKGKCTLLPLID
jgi:hypothetical protein